MKIRLAILCLAGVMLAACSTGTTFTARKKVTQGIDYSHYGKNEAYYEFSSAIPNDVGSNVFVDQLLASQTPTVDPAQAPAEQPEDPLGEDEDFVSENLTNSYRNYGDMVVTVASHKFNLGDSATRKDMALFMKAMESAYTKSLRIFQPTGFTYTMSSVGAVNPLSAVQVQCRMSERSANANGQKACKMFFEQIPENYKKAKLAATAKQEAN